MKVQGNLKYALLIIYAIGVLGVFAALISPIITEPRDLAPTKIPSLSISGLMEANRLFNNLGKTWTQYPSEPDISSYTFGGRDPL